MTFAGRRVLSAIGLVAVLAAAAGAGDSFPKRMFDDQNTSNVGDDPAITPNTVEDLRFERMIPVRSEWLNATPVIADGLLFVGDTWRDYAPDKVLRSEPPAGFFYVFDLENGDRPLVVLDTGATVSTPLIGRGIQASAVLATVSVPDGQGGTREQRRVYFGANVKPRSMWCLNVDEILARRKTLDRGDGKDLLCAGADWPIVIAGLGDLAANRLTSPFPVYNASPLFRADQRVRVSGRVETRDVLYTPTIGADCSDGQMWAVDAYTGETLWAYDPVPNYVDARSQSGVSPGYGGVIWTVPALDREGDTIYVTTGDCVEQPQVGFQAESLVALDARDGSVKWFHQRRLIDTSDYDIGNSPTLVNVPGPEGCSVVVTPDKNGCIYAFDQELDVPAVGEPGFDPLRPGQQRVRWRTCLVPGSLYGGFNASGAAAYGRTIFAQARAETQLWPDTIGKYNGFALDACSGELRWASKVIAPGMSEGVIASGMWFSQRPQGTGLQVVAAGPQRKHLADVRIPGIGGGNKMWGGGGPAVVGGRIYVPTAYADSPETAVGGVRIFPSAGPMRGGIAVFSVDPGSRASKPSDTIEYEEQGTYRGPFPAPIAYGVEDPFLPRNLTDPEAGPVPPVSEWPTMNP